MNGGPGSPEVGAGAGEKKIGMLVHYLGKRSGRLHTMIIASDPHKTNHSL